MGTLGIVAGHCVHVAVRPASTPPRDAVPQPGAAGASLDAAEAGVTDEDLIALRVALEHELRLLALQSAAAGDAGGTRRGIFGGSREGDLSDFWLGVAIGLLLGFVGFLCLLEPAAPRKLRAGLFLGA